jgi:hypothetical protein
MCVYTTHGLRWPFAALLAVAGLALGGQAMGGLRQRRVLSSVTLKRRKSWLLALDAFGSVTCTATTGTGNTYPAGISYNRILPGDLTVNLANDVTVNLQTVGTAVSVTNAVGGNVFVNDAGATITAVSPGNANNGIHAQSVTGNVIVTSSGIITLGNSVGGENAIFAGTGGGTASVTYTGPSSGPGLIAGGQESSGIQALNFGNGDAIITASGNVAVSGPNVYGLIAHAGFQLAGAGDASVTFHSGTINASGVAPRGILAWVDGNGSATVTTDAGTFINITGGSPGVLLYTDTATAANGQKLVANIESTITGVGRRARGIEADSNADAPIFVTYTGPGITTAGERANGINGLSRSGSVNVISTGPITTNGFRAYGILADSGTILSSTTFNGAPPGGEPTVVTPSVSGPGGSIVVTTSGQGSITTQGVESHGIWATSTTGTVQVTTTNVSTTGEFSAGINAAGGGGTTVNVAQGASVKGGWQSDVTGVGPTDGLPAAGVILNSSGGTATLNNFGSIGALSDRAVAGDPVVINNGIITGFVQFTGGGNSIENNGLFDLRHFAQTTPNGGRDTLRVAIADLGEGPGNTFNNTGTGTLRLAAVTGATTLDNTGSISRSTTLITACWRPAARCRATWSGWRVSPTRARSICKATPSPATCS